jgi:hypothetical protein
VEYVKVAAATSSHEDSTAADIMEISPHTDPAARIMDINSIDKKKEIKERFGD